MDKKLSLYQDSLHGIRAMAHSDNMAWMLIRVEAKKRRIQVPRIDQIYKVISRQ